LEPGIGRITLPLPTGPRHVHCYVVDGDEGRILVDTGLGVGPSPEWDGLGELSAIAITHFHPDHVGGAERAAAATGAIVHQGELDYAQCERVWGTRDWPDRIAAWFRRNGVPGPVADELLEQGHAYAPFIRYAPDPERLNEGDRVDGWAVLELPGHADGHIGFFRDGVLVAGDHLLPDITPAVGLYPESRPDPLGDYLRSLRRTADLGARLALPGHGEPIRDPAARAEEILAHHEARLAATEAAVDGRPRTGYEVSLALFGETLSPTQRRFAVAETLSHLERLVATGRAARTEDGGSIAYTGS
jgi:glyoxylase-like metal-dependent hydrolase (beta-lactamase superfamily II)